MSTDAYETGVPVDLDRWVQPALTLTCQSRHGGKDY